MSALLLAALFFKLGIEQRVREVGLLRSRLHDAAVRRLFAAEALVLSLAGSVLGIAGALGYGYLMMTGLRTWWVDAVGTTALSLHVAPMSLLAGAAAACSPRSSASGGRCARSHESRSGASSRASSVARRTGRASERWNGRRSVGRSSGRAGAVAFAFGRRCSAWLWWLDGAAARSSARAHHCWSPAVGVAAWLRRPPRHCWPVTDGGLSRLGLRNATYRPGRSVLSMAVVASATFILISVDAFAATRAVSATRTPAPVATR